MPRIPWDELPNRYIKPSPSSSEAATKTPDPVEIIPPRERDFKEDIEKILRRATFGIVCGSITGTTFGFVEVLRDPKSMAGKSSIATQKVLQFAYRFGGFFGCYHGVRTILKLNYPQPVGDNVLTSAALCMVPLIAMPTLRPMIPYGIMLIGLDAINDLNNT